MTDEPTPSPPEPDARASVPLAQGGPIPFVFPGLPPGAAVLGLPQGFAIQQSQVQVWQGQFPPPDAIASYEATLPGAFDRIVTMAERQQGAQIRTTEFAQTALRDDTRRGQLLGFALTLAAIVGAAYCAYIQSTTIALALLGVPLLTVARALVDSARAPRISAPVTPSARPSPPTDAS